MGKDKGFFINVMDSCSAEKVVNDSRLTLYNNTINNLSTYGPVA